MDEIILKGKILLKELVAFLVLTALLTLILRNIFRFVRKIVNGKTAITTNDEKIPECH